MDALCNKRWMVISDGHCVWAYDTEAEAQEHLENIQKFQVCGYNRSYVLRQEAGCYPFDFSTKWEHFNANITINEEAAIAWVKNCRYTMNEGFKKSSFWNKDYYVVGTEHTFDKDRRLAIYKHDNKVYLLIEREEKAA